MKASELQRRWHADFVTFEQSQDNWLLKAASYLQYRLQMIVSSNSWQDSTFPQMSNYSFNIKFSQLIISMTICLVFKTSHDNLGKLVFQKTEKFSTVLICMSKYIGLIKRMRHIYYFICLTITGSKRRIDLCGGPSNEKT